jgi:hypothetical protein
MNLPVIIALFALGILVVLVLSLALPQSLKTSRLKARHCVHCGYDLRASADRCPECGNRAPAAEDESEEAGLADDFLSAPPIEPRKPLPDERLVSVCTTSNALEANFIAQVLEHRGITTVVEGQPRPTDYQPVTLRVMVWSADKEAAAPIVDEIGRRQAERRAMRG